MSNSVEALGGPAEPLLDAARLMVKMRRSRAAHLDRLRAVGGAAGARIVPSLLYVPYLFLRSYGLRSTRQIADGPGCGARKLTRAQRRSPVTIEALLAAKEIVVVCGPGGVGKTTMAAAAAAMAACHQGGKVLVVTVDPARRLATALGLRHGRGVERVRPSAFAGARGAPRGELWAEMLDTKQSWDALVNRHAPDAATAKRILDNPLYQDISGPFRPKPRLHSRRAPLRAALRRQVRFDRRGHAPDSQRSRFPARPRTNRRLLQLEIVAPLDRALPETFCRCGFEALLLLADRVLGSQFLQDLAEFFILFQTLSDGFVERAQEVQRLLADRRTTFIVVSTLEDMPVREAEAFMDLLPRKDFHLGGVVLNRVLPTYLLQTDLVERASRLSSRAGELARSLCSGPVEGADPALVARVLKEVGTNFNNIGVVANREASQRSELSRLYSVVASVPQLEDDVHDLTGVLELGRHIWSGGT